MSTLSERLQYIRAMHNLSQAALAKLAKTTQQAIQQAEAGKARNPRYLHHLAQALDIPLEWMMFGEVEDAPPMHAVPEKEADATFDDSAALQDGYQPQEILDSFFSMSEKEQKLLVELMKSRRDK